MAIASYALALAAMAALLLFGCMAEPKPAEGMQGIVVQNAEGLINEVQPAKTGTQATTPGQNATESKNCSIGSASVVRGFSSFYYEWTIHFDGFSDGDTLTWACGRTVAKKTISSGPVWGMPRFEVVSCDFPSAPKDDYINVSIGGVQCGQAPARQG
ncbi:MAG: hypothetical protein WCY41_03135 [Candidatus Micrarchaeia archaeon]